MKKINLNKKKKNKNQNNFADNALDNNEEIQTGEKNKESQRMDVKGKAEVLNKPKLHIGKTIPSEQIDEIIKTTDSMQIVSKSFKNTEETDSKRLLEASRAILKSYDLAIRKIKATYQDVIDTKKSISNEFLTVQILIKKYEEFPDIKQISKVINLFFEELETLLSYGKGIWFSNELVFEAADYINKMIPIARIVTPDAIIVNMLKWHEVAENLIRNGKISISEKSIIESLVEAVGQNLKNGYYMKCGNLIVSRIRPNDPECMILFNGETIHRMNKIYSSERASRRKDAVNKLNYLSKFMSNVSLQKEKDQKEMKKIDLEIRGQKFKEKEKALEIEEREDNNVSKNQVKESFKEKEHIDATENFEDDVISNQTDLEDINVIEKSLGSETEEIKEDINDANEAKEEVVEDTKEEVVEDTKEEVVEDTKEEVVEDIKDENIEIIDKTTETDLGSDDSNTLSKEPDVRDIKDEDLGDHVEDYVDPKNKKAVKAAKKEAKLKAKADKKKTKLSKNKKIDLDEIEPEDTNQLKEDLETEDNLDVKEEKDLDKKDQVVIKDESEKEPLQDDSIDQEQESTQDIINDAEIIKIEKPKKKTASKKPVSKTQTVKKPVSKTQTVKKPVSKTQTVKKTPNKKK